MNYELRIQPNPAKDEVLITVNDELLGTELKIIDVNGQLIAKHELTTHNRQLSTENFPNGIYFVQAVTEKGAVEKRLVIAR